MTTSGATRVGSGTSSNTWPPAAERTEPLRMHLNKVTIEDLPLRGKRVIIRADFNVPLDESGHITDDTRIRGTLPTINYAVDEGARVILCSHLGRPKGKVDPRLSLPPLARRLQRLLGKEVLFAEDCIGAQAEMLVNRMKAGDVLLLENLRFHVGEEQNDDHFAKALAALADVYVNDAFGAAHRNHASVAGITKYLPMAGAGFRSEEHTSELQSRPHLVCRLLLEKKKDQVRRP